MSVLKSFRFSEVGILSFVLSPLDYLLTTDGGQSTKPLGPNVSFRCNFGRMVLITFGIGLLGVTEAEFSSSFSFHTSLLDEEDRLSERVFWRCRISKCKKKDYMVCTASFPPSWSSPTCLTGCGHDLFQTALPGTCKSPLPSTSEHMSENCLWHKSKCRSNTDPFYNHHVAEVLLWEFYWTGVIR